MKQKIKIMKHKQQPSDEEIQQYMNFDALLDHRKMALNASRTATTLKWSVSIFIATVTVVGFFFAKNVLQSAVQKDNKESGAPEHLRNESAPLADSLTESEPIAEMNANKENRSAPRIERDKQVEKSAKQKSKPEISESGYMQAEPVNGYADLYNYFNSHLVYPTEVLKDSIQGVQTISFVINIEGRPEQIEVVKSLGAPFEKESRRLIENMPAWKPATLNGKPVASKISLPLTFQIQKIKN